MGDDRAEDGGQKDAEETVDKERVETVGLPESTLETHRAEGLVSLEEARQAAATEGSSGDRYEQLLEKRREAGLSEEEANELGRLIAEREGQDYSTNSRLGDGSAGGGES